MQREALTIRKSQGSESPTVAASLVTLATVLTEEQKMTEAEALVEEAVALYGKLIRSEDPAPASDPLRLGMLLEGHRKYSKAYAMLRATVVRRKRLFEMGTPA